MRPSRCGRNGVATIGSVGAKPLILACTLLALSCRRTGCTPSPSSDAGADAATPTTVAVLNRTPDAVTVYVAFGANSIVTPTSWGALCTASTTLSCSFSLAGQSMRSLPLAGQYFNATIAFAAPVGCSTTKAEINVNNPLWYDVYDLSLVDGYSNALTLDATDANGTRSFSVRGATGNEKALGVFPFACDVCVARQNPPCGYAKGSAGCKAGTQYQPSVPCQYQGPTRGGGTAITITYAGGG